MRSTARGSHRESASNNGNHEIDTASSAAALAHRKTCVTSVLTPGITTTTFIETAASGALDALVVAPTAAQYSRRGERRAA